MIHQGHVIDRLAEMPEGTHPVATVAVGLEEFG